MVREGSCRERLEFFLSLIVGMDHSLLVCMGKIRMTSCVLSYKKKLFIMMWIRRNTVLAMLEMQKFRAIGFSRCYFWFNSQCQQFPFLIGER